MPDGRPWPRISIVTPSYNQGDFVEQTLRSVLLQGYPSLEYIVMDGGSSDESAEILERYRPFLTHLSIGPDGGQSAAINAGFARATGEILAWINSDDGYFPQALKRVASAMRPAGMVTGNSVGFDGNVARYMRVTWFARQLYRTPGFFAQPSTFWHKDIHEPLDKWISNSIDFELWLRLVPRARTFRRIDQALSYAYLHPLQKTVGQTDVWDRDARIIGEKHGPDICDRPIGPLSPTRAFQLVRLVQNLSSRTPDGAEVVRLIEGRRLEIEARGALLQQTVRRGLGFGRPRRVARL